MKACRASVIAILMAGSCCAGELPLVPDGELSIDGVSIGDEEAMVLRKLGKPSRVSDTGDFLNIQIEYPGLTIWLGENRRVGEILSTSAQRCTPSGVCPGQPFSLVQDKHGPPLVAEREDGRFMEYLPTSDFSCWLQIAVADGIVKSLRTECQP